MFVFNLFVVVLISDIVQFYVVHSFCLFNKTNVRQHIGFYDYVFAVWLFLRNADLFPPLCNNYLFCTFFSSSKPNENTFFVGLQDNILHLY